mmetsp:Transcript_17164/g.28704  ORF Transcript_17164/g.28704 Transcript_17164/m.28704 type:complete len:455 (+) Transcript_17164:177-1541(+)
MGITSSDQRHVIHAQPRHPPTSSTTFSSAPPSAPTIAQAQLIYDNRAQVNNNDFDFSPLKPTTRHVGLENKTGENNCFLNATIQALWHLNLFREKVLYTEQLGGGEENIDLIFSEEDSSVDTLGALCSLFAQYQYTDHSCIPSSEIRCILSQLDGSGRFDLGSMADAAETLEALLSFIHAGHVGRLSASSQAASHDGDFCHAGSTKCLSHTIFGGVFVSQSTCRVCRATNEPAIIEPFFHHASVLALLDCPQAKSRFSFGQRLNVAFRNADVACPSTDSSRPLSARFRDQSGGRGGGRGGVCSGRAEVNLSCLEAPQVLAVSLAWPGDSVPQSTIRQLLQVMEGHVWLSEVFSATPPDASCSVYQSRSDAERYIFKGFVCFYGMHYISIFQEWNPAANICQYMLFDDSHIRRLGRWEDVKEECVRARYQPVLLLYEKQPPNKPPAEGAQTCSHK